ncbi:MAG: sigma-70 family RNA polymerase sigma factor [Cyanobacteria bacterium NC_groundwater_1444_Ag_S-0.65um_54_12]|nr:sigma-70 family RNA polymerase sigma factor [Cyanobacteria bacterium NC_groundwater_1444_Ag_S-0.65um_54_12]
MVSTPEQRELICRARNGDKAAFETLIGPQLDRFYGLAYQLIRNEDDAADVVQEALIKAYRSLGSFRGDADFFTWMARILRNTVLDELKRAVRRHEEPVETLPESLDRSLEGKAEQKELREIVHGCISQLSSKLREPLVMFDIEGYSYEEISQILGINIGTVKSRLNRARESLRQKLNKQRNRLAGWVKVSDELPAS